MSEGPRYLTLEEYLTVASEVTGLPTSTVVAVTDLTLADSALHAPQAGFAGQDLYPDVVDKAAVLIVRLARNHPLPDGNKRAAWTSLRVFLALNDLALDPYPTVDEAEDAVVSIAGGDWDERATAAWLRPRLRRES